ncbi:hypothetical protein WDW89_20900 [Deltaproteobacteria bacterium TL4]
MNELMQGYYFPFFRPNLSLILIRLYKSLILFRSNIEQIVQSRGLLTRLLFVWFIKEKKLIPEELFDVKYLKENLLIDLSPFHETGLFRQTNIDSNYYKAILQNLFFATLNCPKVPLEKGDTRKRGFKKTSIMAKTETQIF